MADHYRTIVRPVVTEKSSAAYGARKEYTFETELHATKPEIRAAIEHLFGVRVKKVRTAVQRSRQRSLGRTTGRRPKWKKAFVELREGDSIEIFEG